MEKNKEFGMRNPSGFGLFLDENNIVKLRIIVPHVWKLLLELLGLLELLELLNQIKINMIFPFILLFIAPS